MKSDVQALEYEVKSMTEIINILRDELKYIRAYKEVRRVRKQKNVKHVPRNVVNVRNLNLNCKWHLMNKVQ
jgi:hypothetical protein